MTVQAVIETLKILLNKKLMKNLRQSIKENDEGKLISFEEFLRGEEE